PRAWLVRTRPAVTLTEAAANVSGAVSIRPVRRRLAPTLPATTHCATLVAGPSPMKTASWGSTTLKLGGYVSGPAGTPGRICPSDIASFITAFQVEPSTVALEIKVW